MHRALRNFLVPKNTSFVISVRAVHDDIEVST